jgi:hypothetical protein
MVSVKDKSTGNCIPQGRKEKVRTKTLVVFQTHILTKGILVEFERIRKVVDQDTDVLLFYDNSLSDFCDQLVDFSDQCFLFKKDVIRKFFKPRLQSVDFVGYVNLPLLYFSQHHPEYDYYWSIEYDVRFTGDWKSFIDSFVSTEADLLGTTIYRYKFRPEWFYWGSIQSPEAKIDTDKLIRGFFPIYRLSKKACGEMIVAYLQGWLGHFEVLMPTILHGRGYIIEDIGGDGEFTPTERRNRFYQNSPENDGLAPGTFVFRPEIASAPNRNDMLYHPVKSEVWDLE